MHRSDLEFTVEGDAIRFGLLAVKNVGQGAIESIIAARGEGGPFRSLADFCSRIDLRLANRKVLESLIQVGALNGVRASGAAAARARRRRRRRVRPRSATGSAARRRCSTWRADDAVVLERPLPPTTEVPVRERLRWEKELLGLYLSEHPMGEVAEQVGEFVNAYSSDLKDEALDGQRVVVGGIVTGHPHGHHEAPGDDGVATLEDLQGTHRGRRLPAAVRADATTWAEGAILLVAGRVDHKGEEVSLLADLVERLGRGRRTRAGGVRPRGCGGRPERRTATAERAGEQRQRDGHGPSNGHGARLDDRDRGPVRAAARHGVTHPRRWGKRPRAVPGHCPARAGPDVHRSADAGAAR